METFIFIDTNILLDFYRIRKTEVSEKYLKLIDLNLNKIISSYQVEMEYKKNRQIVILEAFNAIKSPEFNSITPPALLANSDQVRIIENNKKTINKKIRELKNRIDRILLNPVQNDKAYQTFQRLFKYDSKLILNRNFEDRERIKELAKKRFLLGYPPRKKDDTSFGDAYNWEWLIDVSIRNPSNLIIVSRDSDYGIAYNNKLYINDWLAQEYKDRVSKKRKILLTDKLSVAFKALSQKVTQEMELEEQEIINIRNKDILKRQYETTGVPDISEIGIF